MRTTDTAPGRPGTADSDLEWDCLEWEEELLIAEIEEFLATIPTPPSTRPRTTELTTAGRRPAHDADAGTTQRDLFSLTEGQVSPLQSAPAARAHATGLTHPCQTALTMGAGDGRGIGHELTGLPCGPERLNQIGHQLVRETDCHRHPHILGCCDDRKDLRNPLRDGAADFRQAKLVSMSEVVCTLNREFAAVCRRARAVELAVLVCTAVDLVPWSCVRRAGDGW